ARRRGEGPLERNRRPGAERPIKPAGRRGFSAEGRAEERTTEAQNTQREEHREEGKQAGGKGKTGRPGASFFSLLSFFSVFFPLRLLRLCGSFLLLMKGAAEKVQGRIAHRLGQGRVGVADAGHVLGAAAELQHRRRLRDQLRGARPEDV